MKIIDIESVPRKKSMDHTKGGAIQKDLKPLKKSTPSFSVHKKAPSFRTYVYYMLAFGLVAIMLWGTYFYRQCYRANIKAQNALVEAVYAFEQGHFEQALQGTPSYLGFEKILEQYPHTKTVALVRFYAGLAYMHQKQYDKAIACLEACTLNSTLVQARMLCVLGDAYSYSQQYLKASKAYIKAANCAHGLYAPSYWLKAALVLQKNQQYKQAYDCYQHIIKTYPKASVQAYAVEEAAHLALLL